MVDVITTGSSGGAWDNATETAYDRSVEFYLRDDPQWRQLIDKRPVDQAMPGDVVTLTTHQAFASLATSPLTDGVDVSAVAAAAPTRTLVTLQEWGNVAMTTLKLRKTAFTNVDADIAELVGRNMYDSIDTIVRSVADAGTNLLWVNGGILKTSGGANASVAATDVLTRAPAVAGVKLLQRAKVLTKQANRYVAVIHPDVAYDLQAENSATAWTAPHTYGGDTEAIYSGAVGDYQGARYIETTRTNITTDGAAGAKVYSTYYFGRQALVEASAEDPHIVIGPQTDHLRRNFPIGWYALAGWSIFRPQALVTVRTSSSIQAL